MNRRQFVASTGALLGSGIVAHPASAVTAEKSAVTPAARALYRKAVVLDANLGPGFDDEKLPLSAATLASSRESGLTAIKTTLGGFNADFEATLREIGFYLRALELHRDRLVQIRQANDIAAAKRDGRLGIIFSFEGVTMLADKLDRIQLFRDLGVRVMQLSYNPVSPFG